jgi:membrane-associated phospholipid phosphatase
MNLELFEADGAFPLYQSGLELVRTVQSISSPALTTAMKFITGVVSEYVFFSAIMIFFWTVRERKAFRLGVLIICGLWLNMAMKALFNMPRPFQLDSTLGMISERGGGFPSGHAQLAALVLIPPAVWYGRKYRTDGGILPPVMVWTAGIVLILVVSFSRIYLGVHFLQDILGGWVFAAVCLVIFFAVEKRTIPWGLKRRLVLAAAASLLMNALYPRERIPGALLLGFAAGYAILRDRIPFIADKAQPLTAALRVLTGFAGAAAVYMGLKALFPGPSSEWYELFRFVRYMAVGFWVAAGAPLVFFRFFPDSRRFVSMRDQK